MQSKMSSVVKQLTRCHVNEIGFEIDTESTAANLTFRNSMTYLVQGCVEAFLESSILEPLFIEVYPGLIAMYNDLLSVPSEKAPKPRGVKSQKEKVKVKGKAIRQDYLEQPIARLDSI